KHFPYATQQSTTPMPNYRRADIPGGTFFFTVSTYRRRAILVDDDVREAFREGIQLARHTPV
ncbi:MAG: hypothetical protein ACRERV_07370, partial [Methylococcales bacterium]